MMREEARQIVSATLGQSESAELVLDYLEESWATLDQLTVLFGSEQACALLLAHACFAVLDDFPEQADDRTNQQENACQRPGKT